MQPAPFPGLRLDKRTAETPAPFAIRCACGVVLRGLRQFHAQTVTCPACRAERFVLPRSPLPPVTNGETSAAPATGSISRWRWWLAGGAAAIVLAVVGLSALIYFLVRTPTQSDKHLQTPDQQFVERQTAGRAAFAEGSFQRAATELQAALAIADQLPGRLTVTERREIRHQQRQAAIVADLLNVPLTEVVRNSIGTPDAEWQAVFARHFAGRSVIFDETLHRDAAGQFHVVFQNRVPAADCKIDLQSLRVLKEVAISGPQRVLFGFRVAGIRREMHGWTILPEPGSGVFLTDPQILSGLPTPPDAELLDVLKRQRQWVDQLP